MPWPGTVVFNPSPYSRTELVTLADGTERMVTNLPALGYAYVPLGGSTDGRWRATERGDQALTLETAQFRVVLDPDTGAIRSLISQNDGREWVRQGVLGLNELDGAQLLEHTRLVLPGVGLRIVARRRSPEFGSVRSTVTVYDHLPHVDVSNHAPPESDHSLEQPGPLFPDLCRGKFRTPHPPRHKRHPGEHYR